MMGRLALAAVAFAALAGSVPAQEATRAPGAVLRLLDKTAGQVEDVDLFTGQVAQLGGIDIAMGECRYPSGNPSGDAFARLDITERDGGETLFSGWMIASSPALSALDHARYDVWVLRCKTS
ncbi:MAG: DUF2155 domain-containing protein [Pseudomonadota bacterium]